MIVDAVRDGLHPPAARVPQIFGALTLLFFGLWVGTRLHPFMLLLIMLPNLLTHFAQRALATYIDLDSVPPGSTKRLGTFFNPKNQKLLSQFLRACAIHHLWQMPLLVTAGSGAILLTRAPGSWLGLYMMWGGFVTAVLVEFYVLWTGARTAICFRRDRCV